MREALLTRDWIDVAELLGREWENRKQIFEKHISPK